MNSKLTERSLIQQVILLLAAFILAGIVGGSALAQEQQKEEETNIEKQRQEWFYGQRAYPHQHVPARAHLNAVKELRRMQARERDARQRRPLSPSLMWTNIGPQPVNTPYTDPVVSGRVTALAVANVKTGGAYNTVYLGGALGGVWKTTNAGTSWTALTDSQPSLAVGSILIDPASTNTVWVGTGEENFGGDNYYGEGILKSTDGGATWTQYCGGFTPSFCGPTGMDSYYGGGATIGALALQPGTTGSSAVLLAAVAEQDNTGSIGGVYRSTDGGVTWTNTLLGFAANSVMFDLISSGVAYATLGAPFTGQAEGVYKSTNNGMTWTAVNGTGASALPLTNAGRIVLALAPDSSALYAGIAKVSTDSTDGSSLGIYKSTDGGTTWTNTDAPDYCQPQCYYDNVIGVDPAHTGVVYAGGAYTTTLIQSVNAGGAWTTIQSAQNGDFLHADMHALGFAPDGSVLFAGNDGGVYSAPSPDTQNPTFTALNNTALTITQFYPGLSIMPGNPSIAIGGTQDNGTEIYSGTTTWNQVACGDGGYTAIDFTNTNNYYAACNQFDIEKSTSSGSFNSWNPASSGINTGDRINFIAPLVMDPSNSSNLYFGTDKVYQTTNGATNWTAISGDLTNGPGFWGVVTTIAVAPTSSNTVYAGTGDSNVQVTTNALAGSSATWNNRSSGLPPASSRVITHIAVDPTTSNTAYVSFSGFTGFGDSLGHIFQTTNSGTNWTDISGNLPNTPVNTILIVPNYPTELFLGTDVGVFYTTNVNGASTDWSTLVDGLPNVAVLGLAYDVGSTTLRASTHGRGVWDINVNSILPVPGAAFSPIGLAFAPQTIGVATTLPLTISNNGGANLNITNITTTGDFSQTNNCTGGGPIAPGGNCTVNVQFTPSATGPRKGTISVSDNAAGSPQTVIVTGVGAAASLSPTSLTFGSVSVGSQSSPQTVTLTNDGPATINIWQIAITGADAGDFSKTTTCTNTLAHLANCTISVTFKPTATGSRTASLLISNNGGGSPQAVALSGTGTSGPARLNRVRATTKAGHEGPQDR